MAQKLHEENYDVVVVGGGCAGVAAAVSAAKNGAKTLHTLNNAIFKLVDQLMLLEETSAIVQHE